MTTHCIQYFSHTHTIVEKLFVN